MLLQLIFKPDVGFRHPIASIQMKAMDAKKSNRSENHDQDRIHGSRHIPLYAPQPGAIKNEGNNMTSKIMGMLAVGVLGLGSVGTASAAVMEQISPVPITYTFSSDYYVATGSGVGDVTAALSPVDLQLLLEGGSTSGCEAADFVGFAAGTIALIRRGVCTFAVKALNAQAAGAAGVLIFNQGQDSDVFGATLGGLYVVNIPVLTTSYAIGAGFANVANGVTLRMRVDAGDWDSSVPEPGTLTLLGLGLLGMGVSRRKA